MKFSKYIFLIFAFLLLNFAFTVNANAADVQPPQERLKSVGSDTGPYANTSDTPADSMAVMIGSVVQILISLLGVIFISLALYAGFLYMTAQGNDEKISKSLATLRNAVIGLIITVSSYGIWTVIYNKLLLGN